MTSPSSDELERAVEALRSGHIVCVPTESTYGLAVDPSNASALQRLVDLKGRSSQSPFALMASSLRQAQDWTGVWPSAAERLAKRYWPGPLTLILPPADKVLAILLGPSGGLGVRVSSLQLTRDLAHALGRPITATSANPSGQPPATTLKQARDYFPGAFGADFDGGECADQASTLVDFGPGGAGQVLREGPIALPSLDEY